MSVFLPGGRSRDLRSGVSAGGGRADAGVHEASHANTTRANTTQVNKMNAVRAEPPIKLKQQVENSEEGPRRQPNTSSAIFCGIFGTRCRKQEVRG